MVFFNICKVPKIIGHKENFQNAQTIQHQYFSRVPKENVFNFYNISGQEKILKLLKFFQASLKFFLPNLFEHQDFSSSQIFKQK